MSRRVGKRGLTASGLTIGGLTAIAAIVLTGCQASSTSDFPSIEGSPMSTAVVSSSPWRTVQLAHTLTKADEPLREIAISQMDTRSPVAASMATSIYGRFQQVNGCGTLQRDREWLPLLSVPMGKRWRRAAMMAKQGCGKSARDSSSGG